MNTNNQEENVLEILIQREIEAENEKVRTIIEKMENNEYCSEFEHFCRTKKLKLEIKKPIEELKEDKNICDEFIKYTINKKQKRIRDLKQFLKKNKDDVDNDLNTYRKNEKKIEQLEKKNRTIECKYSNFVYFYSLLKEQTYIKYPLLKDLEELEEKASRVYMNFMSKGTKNKSTFSVLKLLHKIVETKKAYLDKNLIDLKTEDLTKIEEKINFLSACK